MSYFLFGLVVLGLTAMPIIFRASRLIRCFCLFLIFLLIVIILFSCVHLAARNVLSKTENSQHKVDCNTAKYEVAIDVQRNVDRFLFPLVILSASLVLIAAFPYEKERIRGTCPKGTR